MTAPQSMTPAEAEAYRLGVFSGTWRIPDEPTPEMIRAVDDYCSEGKARDVWRLMLATYKLASIRAMEPPA